MLGQEHEIFVYAPDGPPINGATLVPCFTYEERTKLFGEYDPDRNPSWPTDQQFVGFNEHVVEALKEHLSARDLILISAGWCHKLVYDSFPAHIRCEQGVGYEGIISTFCAFPSYAWMHYVYVKKKIDDGRWYDVVIPHFVDSDEFPKLNSGKGKYLLFLGRIIERKGPHIAGEIAQRTGLPLKVAGPSGRQVGEDIAGAGVTIKNAEYVGSVNIRERAELLANAKALVVPTTYFEPFGNVVIEAMMAGTPAITTDWGAFPETVHNGVSGFRFRTLKEAAAIIEKALWPAPSVIRQYATQRFSLAAVTPKFNHWFNQLDSLWGKGWYA